MRSLIVLLVLCVGVSTGCHSGADCGQHECCVILEQGKQECQAFLPEKQVCHLLSGRNPFEKPAMAVSECICAVGLSCVADGVEMGLEGHGMADHTAQPLGPGAKGTCQMLLMS